MFYPQEEFEAQMNELLALGYPEEVAYDIVRTREMEDEEDYLRWLDEQDSWEDIGCEFDKEMV